MHASRLSRVVKVLLSAGWIVAGSAAPLFSQQAMNASAVAGAVVDPSGAAIAGAAVSITNLERDLSFSTTTDASGRFRFLSLTVGPHELRVTAPGFAAARAAVSLSVGQSLEIPVRLSVPGITTEIDVGAEISRVEITRSQAAERILPQEIETLPLGGRNYLDLALLVPAVSRTNTGNNERFAETSAVPGTGISVAGQRNLANTFIMDGLSANDDAADLAGTFFSQEVIREFQVVTAGGSAEFGRASSGVVNIVSQSGTNEWRGKLYGFLRNQRLDAAHVFAAADAEGRRMKNPLTQAQYGASLGGPIQRNRSFFFSNLEREDLHRSGFVTVSPANAAAINGVLDDAGYAAPRLTTGEYPTGSGRTSVFLKSDFDFSSGNRMAVRYNLYDISSPNARGVGGLSVPSRGTIIADRDQTAALSHVRARSASVNEARLQFTRSRFEAPGNDLTGPAVNVSGVANFGASTTSPTGRDIDLFEASDAYSLQKGAHLLKLGAGVLHNNVGIEFPGTLYGVYAFNSMASFLTGAYTSYSQAFGDTRWSQANPNLSWFIQDEWRLSRAWTLNAGVRQDVSWLAAGIETRGANIAPRIGLAWAPGGQKTVVRAAFGRYYDRIPLRAVANALRGAGTGYRAVTLQRSQVGAPAFPGKLAAFPSGVLFNLATIDPRIRNASSLQSSLQIEREITGSLSTSVGYLYVRGTHIIMQRNLNVPTRTAAQDPVNLGRPDSRFANVNQYSGQGDSYYSGMTVSAAYRGAGALQGRVSYTLSKSVDNTGNAFFNSPQDNFDIRADRGLSDNDQRHRLILSGRLAVPAEFTGGFWPKALYGMELSSIFTYASPYPFNVLTGGQTLQTTAARPAGLGRNTGRGFPFSSLDVRLSRKIRLRGEAPIELLIESFNVLNHTNLQFPNNTFGTGSAPLPAFGMATNAADPRQVQVGMKISF